MLDECLAAIDAHNAPLNAFVHLDSELAHRAAEAVDAAVARGDDPGPLAGVPFGVKDLEDCEGMPTSQGSLLYKGRPPVEADSIHVGRLRRAGAVPVGKTAAPEFGSTAFTHTKAWGTTRNPWNLERTPGGSSGGSAAAVVSGMVPFCTASDGGGSTRIPAAFSGLLGLKASYGRIAHEDGGAVADVGGRRAHDDGGRRGAAPRRGRGPRRPRPGLVAGADGSLRGRHRVVGRARAAGRLVARPRVRGGRPGGGRHLPCRRARPRRGGRAAARRAALRGGQRHAHVVVVGAVDMWIDLEPGMWPERSADFTGLVRAGLERSEEWTVPRFGRALRHRRVLEEAVADLFRDVDVLLLPSTAVAAFAAAGPMPMEVNGRDAKHCGPVPFTMLANLCWNPAVSVPAGLTSEGLPVGLQIVGRRHADDVVLRLARLYEQARPWPRFAPSYR